MKRLLLATAITAVTAQANAAAVQSFDMALVSMNFSVNGLTLTPGAGITDAGSGSIDLLLGDQTDPLPGSLDGGSFSYSGYSIDLSSAFGLLLDAAAQSQTLSTGGSVSYAQAGGLPGFDVDPSSNTLLNGFGLKLGYDTFGDTADGTANATSIVTGGSNSCTNLLAAHGLDYCGSVPTATEEYEWAQLYLYPTSDKTGFKGGHLVFQSGGAANITTTVFELTKAEVSPVPVPAAAWLFGSALIGLAGVGRKRKMA